jgi:hypothetical protein
MQDSTICYTNIGPRGRQRRLQSGLRQLALGGAFSAALTLLGLPRWWRVVVAAPFTLGAIGVFQAYEQTCVMLAARGIRNLDAGEEEIADPTTMQQLRRQARKVYAESALAAVLLTAAVLALPRRAAPR